MPQPVTAQLICFPFAGETNQVLGPGWRTAIGNEAVRDRDIAAITDIDPRRDPVQEMAALDRDALATFQFQQGGSRSLTCLRVVHRLATLQDAVARIDQSHAAAEAGVWRRKLLVPMVISSHCSSRMLRLAAE